MQASQVKSASRAIEILEYFRLVQQERSMSEIAADLGYPQSSATVLLKTLINLGYLNFDRRARLYFPTPKVTSLGDWIPRKLFGTGEILDAMRDVHAATGEGIFIGSKNDIYLQYVQTMDSIHALRFHLDEGVIRPLTQSAAGWVLLSTVSDEKIDNLVRRANIATPSAQRVKVRDMMEKITEVRTNGYAVAENVPLEGGRSLCALLPATMQGQPVVLGMGGIMDRMRKNHDRYLNALLSAVRSVKVRDDFDVPIQIEL
ncbi:IclR family transcriptional regulator [Oryzicola mucosus]|uniref:Helix-turn-helix domain-containing protein n=1 Tax=Oryzicola mucosus TaxID=2767425 RepID=A0A8J6PLQ5_9HYPH|nr:helix-turn-helix domain-containing protein [Oryzicola mucosus]MBD0413857.1 helix-turn-helix domain-containing protein [Oryzicola mucosus]